MPTDTLAPPALDRATGFTIPARHARGRLVRLGPALATVLGHHDYPAPLARVLAEALVLAALVGSTLKEAGGQLTLQAQTQGGAADLLVCDYRGGALRGYLRHDPARVAALGVAPDLAALLGEGYLAITFDQAATGERYQGIVPLAGDSLAAACESYFAQSEQIPSLVRIGLDLDHPDGPRAGGLLLQHLPEGEEGRERLHTRLDHPEWEAVAALGRTVSAPELADPSLPLDHLLWRLFNEEEVRVLPAPDLAARCRCDPAHVQAVIARFPADERRAMAGANGLIQVDCEFCGSRFRLDPDGAQQR